jgi:sarcosine oxidase subunit alpha
MSDNMQRRIHKGTRGHKISFKLDGLPCSAYKGETIATALLALGKRTFRLTPKQSEPRGIFCGMGVCFECLVTVNGVLNVRACMTSVEEGMHVETGVNKTNDSLEITEE